MTAEDDLTPRPTALERLLARPRRTGKVLVPLDPHQRLASGGTDLAHLGPIVTFHLRGIGATRQSELVKDHQQGERTNVETFLPALMVEVCVEVVISDAPDEPIRALTPATAVSILDRLADGDAELLMAEMLRLDREATAIRAG